MSNSLKAIPVVELLCCVLEVIEDIEVVEVCSTVLLITVEEDWDIVEAIEAVVVNKLWEELCWAVIAFEVELEQVWTCCDEDAEDVELEAGGGRDWLRLRLPFLIT